MTKAFAPSEPSDTIVEFTSFDDFRMRIYFMFTQALMGKGIHGPVQLATHAAKYTESAMAAYQAITQPQPGEKADDVR